MHSFAGSYRDVDVERISEDLVWRKKQKMSDEHKTRTPCYECSFESRLQRLNRIGLRQTSSDISSSSANTLARDNLVNFSTLLVDPCSVLVLERRESRLNSLKDLLLGVEKFECRLVFETFEEYSISGLRSGGRVDEFYSSILAVW